MLHTPIYFTEFSQIFSSPPLDLAKFGSPVGGLKTVSLVKNESNLYSK